MRTLILFKINYSFILAISISTLYINGASSSEIDLCAPNEIEVAACQIDEPKQRLVSFCLDNKKDLVTYRFGKKNSTELTVEFTNERQLQRWTDIVTYTVYFGFKRGEYSYVFGVPQETVNAKAFLSVKRGNEALIYDKLCTGNSFGDKKLSSKAIINLDDEDVRNSGFDFPK